MFSGAVNPTTVPSHPPPEQAELQAAVAGRYSIERELGRGGMGVVYLAHDLALARPVAIKVLSPELARTPEQRGRFLREARTVAQLSHPHIVTIHGVEEHGDLLFFVMAYVEGESLRNRVERTGPLPASVVAVIVRDMAWALGYAHGRGVVHRDVKPDNILIERASGRAMLTDFGIAHREEERTLSGEGELVGTVQYMSPEQASGGAVDGRSDLYALGLTGLFAMCGSAPVPPGPVVVVLGRILTGPPPSADVIAPASPEPLRRLIDQCVQRNPAARPLTGEALAQALDATIAPAELAPVFRSAITATRDSVSMLFLPVVAALPVALYIREVGWHSLLILPVAMPFLAALSSAYTVMKSYHAIIDEGHQFEDLRVAVARAHRTLAEEAAIRMRQEFSAPRGPRERAAYAVLMGLLGVGAVAVGIDLVQESGWVSRLTRLAGIALIGAVAHALHEVRRVGALGAAALEREAVASVPKFDPARLLVSRVGAWAFARVQRARDTTRQRRARAETAQPTQTQQLIFAQVAEALRLLPIEVQGRLGDVTALASALQGKADTIRRRLLSAEAALRALPDGHAERAAFAASHQRLEARLQTVHQALEGMRLELLRVGAGLADEVSITGELERARELGAVIDAELEGIREVRRLVG